MKNIYMKTSGRSEECSELNNHISRKNVAAIHLARTTNQESNGYREGARAAAALNKATNNRSIPTLRSQTVQKSPSILKNVITIEGATRAGNHNVRLTKIPIQTTPLNHFSYVFTVGKPLNERRTIFWPSRNHRCLGYSCALTGRAFKVFSPASETYMRQNAFHGAQG